MPGLPAGRHPAARGARGGIADLVRRIGTVLASIGAAWAAGTLALLAVHVLLPQRRGVLVITQIFEPYIVLPALIVAPLALIGRRRPALVVLALFVGAVAIRYGPQWLSVPASVPAGGVEVRVVTWNIEGDAIPITDFLATLRVSGADLVGLEEVIPSYSAAIEADEDLTALYPYRVLPARSGFRGMGLLSRFPITERDRSIDPPYVHARVDPAVGEPFAVVVAHPILGRASNVGLLPVDLDTEPRDEGIERIRGIVDDELAVGVDILLIGDFNLTEREPAYAELTRGLWDAHAEVGQGPGFTWRHQRLKHLPFGILRIDYAFGGGNLRPVASSVDCTPLGSDHCLLRAVFVRPASGTTR